MSRILFLAFIVLSVAGCPCIVCDSMPTLPASTSLRLSYSPGSAGPAAFSVVVLRSGRFLVAQGNDTTGGTLPVYELKSLLAEAQRLNFFGLAPSYGTSKSDQPSLLLALEQREQAHSVSVHGPAPLLTDPDVRSTVYLWSRLVLILRENGCKPCGNALNTVPFVESPRPAT